MITNILDCPKCRFTRKNTLVGYCSMVKTNEDSYSAIYECDICGSVFYWKKNAKFVEKK